ncbi:hypothetical protein J1605_003054 [Eschrichtius robustus]|uniref:Uncharacterized protein n=1 Tax=Eschrichtius robustus TaxID=9764 RepID=A0AB34HUW2_ESCRO|nr:hypothetical protein J1605_003054 [Eschrichtius robustus]
MESSTSVFKGQRRSEVCITQNPNLCTKVLLEKSSILGFLHCPEATQSRASIASRSPGSTTSGAASHRALIAEAQGGRSPGGGGGRSDPRDEAAPPEPRSPPHLEQLPQELAEQIGFPGAPRFPALATPLRDTWPAAGEVKPPEQSRALRAPLPQRSGIRSRRRRATQIPAQVLPVPEGRRASRSSPGALGAGGGDPAPAQHGPATLPEAPRARRPNLGIPSRELGSPGRTREHGSRSTPTLEGGAEPPGRGGAKDLPCWQKGGTRAGRCAAGPRSAPPAGTRGHRRKPTRPAQVTSRPRPPIPRAEAPHWLRSFISRGSSLFPAGRPFSSAPCFSASQ